MMRFTCLSRKAATAAATARYVLPVPAGPTPMVTVCFRMALTYSLLADGLGLDGPALAGDADHILGQLADALGLTGAHQPDDVAHMLVGDRLALIGQGQQRLHGLHRQHYVFRLAGHHDLAAAVHRLHLKFRLQEPDILVRRSRKD